MADYGGMLNAGLCLLHCTVGPVLLAFLSVRQHSSELWEGVFLVMSGLLVAVATWRMSSVGLRLGLWGFFGVFVAAGLLSESYPWLELVQYAASVGLMGTHLLNLRYSRRCIAHAGR
ncbi:hypothetical protein GCM10023186_01980 [Hymenobacter koreensis]|uniref:MerC domain-containing protein n=2 Tax=Hymenobacter koreensis TaxID=1084523 RepID=A0ABP8ITM3_9BACT